MTQETRQQASDFGWFSVWLDGYLGVCVTFARGLSWEQMLAGFGLWPRPVAEETFDQVDADPDRPKVRAGTHNGWGYAVEHFTSMGSRRETMSRLSRNGGEAFALVYTQTIKAFNYAADGEYLSGFDLTVPYIRWGTDPHRFETTMAQAGFLRPGVPDPPTMGPRFVQLTFGITLEQQMLERPLPSVELELPPGARIFAKKASMIPPPPPVVLERRPGE